VSTQDLICALLCASCFACLGATPQRVARAPVTATLSNPSRAWELVQDGKVLGTLVEFEELYGGRRFFSVRNADQQELGLVDEHGRAWRFVPHARDSEWLGSGTIFEGARRILGTSRKLAVFEVDLETLARP
jgi:hypothetical protein